MEFSLKNSDHLVQNQESVFRNEEDGAFLFDPETGNLKYINNMGVNIYQLCDGVITVEDIIVLVTENYKEISKDQIENDIKSYLKSLIEMKFLKKGETRDD